MLKKHKRIIKWFLLFVILASAIYEYGVRWKIRCEIDEGLCLIKKEHGTIFFASVYLYALNVEKGTWDIYMPDEISCLRPQGMAISNNVMVYESSKDYLLKLCPTNKIEEKRNIPEIDYFSRPCALSYNNKKIAFFGMNNLLIVFNFDSKEKREYKTGRAGYISWSADDKFLFVSGREGITCLNLENGNQEFVVDGYWAKALPDNKIGFWRDKEGDSICYKMDMTNKIEKEMFRTRYYLLGADWDPTGRYVLWSTSASIVHGFLFIPRVANLALIWDTETKKKYRLPETTGFLSGGFKTGCIFWVGGHGPGD
jgi:hypothetical protein